MAITWWAVIAYAVMVLTMELQVSMARRIDVHSHFIPPFYRDLSELFNVSAGLQNPAWNESTHLHQMDILGIDLAILSITTPGARFSDNDVEFGRNLARRLNEFGATLSNTYPNRFKFYATLTLPDVEGSIAEAIYALDTLGAVGVKVETNAFGRYFGDAAFDPLMEVLNARNTTVFVHPHHPVDHPDFDILGLPPYLLEYEVDLVRAAINLVSNGVHLRFPNVRIHMSHGAGFIPFQAVRLAAGFGSRAPHGQEAQTYDRFITGWQSLYFDIATIVSSFTLPSLLEFAPPTHIFYGSDWPFSGDGSIQGAYNLDSYQDLTTSQRNEINYQNAQAFFNLQNFTVSA